MLTLDLFTIVLFGLKTGVVGAIVLAATILAAPGVGCLRTSVARSN